MMSFRWGEYSGGLADTWKTHKLTNCGELTVIHLEHGPAVAMRILCVTNSSDIYGASRCLERVFGRLSSEGHNIFVVLPNDGPLATMLRNKGVHVLYHPRLVIIDRREMGSLGGVLGLLVRFPLSTFWLVFWILRLRIDVVHTNTAVMPTPAIAALITMRPHVWHIREFFAEFGLFWRVYQTYVWLLSTTVIAISDAVRAQFSARYLSKVTVVYDGLALSCSGEQSSAEALSLRQRFGMSESVLIGVVGRIKWVRKGQEILVEAFSRLKNHHGNARLVIVGSPAHGNEEHLHRLIALTETRGLAGKVTFTGDIEASQAMYAAMDITVVPSVQPEPFGCVVMESMAAGTVVVGSNCGGIAEQIVNGESGMLFAPGNATELAACLDQLLSNEPLRRRLSRGAQERFQARFRLEQTCANTIQVFQEARGRSVLSRGVREA